MTGIAIGWISFGAFILGMLALDLGVFHRKAHVVSFKEALIWSGVWIGCALLFNLGIYVFEGPDPALDFLTGYLIEKSLSIDNIFVFLMFFEFFRIKPIHQHKVLFWGILGALAMRAAFIFAGIALIHRMHWLIYLFGVFLVFTGIRMFRRKKSAEIHPDKNPLLKTLNRHVPVALNPSEGKFLVVQAGKRLATPMLVCLLFIEAADLIFAVDSIPAILAITSDPFIVYTSNVFAILGMRSLYFAIARFAELFEYLHYGLGAVLVFVGTKMLLADIYKIPPAAALGVVGLILAISIVGSVLKTKRERSRAVVEEKTRRSA